MAIARINNLLKVAERFMHSMIVLDSAHSNAHSNLTSYALSPTDTDIATRKLGEIRSRVASLDAASMDAPYLIADHFLQESGETYDADDVQGLLDRTSYFKKYHPEVFGQYGSFLSVMMARVLPEVQEVTLDTKNSAPVDVPEYFHGGYPLSHMQKLKTYYRDNALITGLASRLSVGKLTIRGNVASLFACENNGADILLEGECGWRACYSMTAGSVTVNGIAGHEASVYARGGSLFVEGVIRSISLAYNTASDHKIFLNGEMVEAV